MKQITCPHCGDTYPDFDVAHVCSKGPYAPRLQPKMNERIRELMAEVGMSVDYLTNTKQIVLIEKFAELIIQECTEVTADWYKNHNQYHMPPDEHIKAHFGVENEPD
jgi:hypothetical protein